MAYRVGFAPTLAGRQARNSPKQSYPEYELGSLVRRSFQRRKLVGIPIAGNTNQDRVIIFTYGGDHCLMMGRNHRTKKLINKSYNLRLRIAVAKS